VSGGEFWVWFVIYGALIYGFVRFCAAWLDHDDDLDAIGSHRWHFNDDDDTADQETP
jgi:hypothetical protein